MSCHEDDLPPPCTILTESVSALAEYSRIPSRFDVRSKLRITTQDQGLGGFLLEEKPVPVPYVKDYDCDPREAPISWPQRFDMANWGIFSAFVNGRRAGGCAVVYRTTGMHMLAGQTDLAVLWDIRVDPAFWGRGIGSSLFDSAVAWARERKCTLLKVETQNINVRACRFYARQGCVLGAIDRFAYIGYPGEVQLIWYKQLQ